MIKACIFGIVTVLVAIFLKGIKNEYGIYAGICGSIILIYMAIQRFSGILEIIKEFESYISVSSEYIRILIRILGIAFVAEFSSNMCRENGYNTISSQIELIGKLSILLISAPIIKALCDTVFSFMK